MVMVTFPSLLYFLLQGKDCALLFCCSSAQEVEPGCRPFLILSARAASLERRQPSFCSENNVMSGGLLHAGLAQDAGVVAFFFPSFLLVSEP